MKRIGTVLIIFLCMFLAFASIGTAKEKIILRFSWWGGESRHKATVAAIERYMQLHPNVEIKPEYSGWDGYHDKLTTQYAGGSAPDISQLDYTMVMEYATRGLILDLTSYKSKYFKDIEESLWGLFRDLSGRIWAVPTGINCVSLYYNKTMFTKFGISYPKPGITWDDVFKIAQKATKDINGDGKIDIYGIDTLFTPSSDAIPVIQYQWGNTMYRNNYSETNFDSGSMKKYLELAKKFQDSKVAPSPQDIVVYTGSQDAFNQGKVAMMPSMLSTIELEQSLMEDELVNIPWPKAVETGLTGTFLKPSQAIVINKKTKYPEEAVKFVSWLFTSPEAAKITIFQRGVSPSRTQRLALMHSNLLSPIQKNIINWTNECAKYADAKPEMSPPGEQEIIDKVIELMQEVQYGRSSIDDIIKRMEKETTEILNRYKK